MADIINTSNRSAWETEVRVKLIGKNDIDMIPASTLSALVSRAERLFKQKIPTWATVLADGGDNKELLIDAAISMLCALLCKPLKALFPVQTSDGDADIVGSHTTRYKVDFDKLETALYLEVDSILLNIPTSTVVTIKRCGVISPETAMFEDLNA